MSEITIIPISNVSQEAEGVSYTYVNAELKAELPKQIGFGGMILPTDPVIPRSIEEKVRLKKHPLFNTDQDAAL
ncbi:MAG: hypothetical protein ABSH17_08515 [Syntrophobacteraceae bacterium]|jgi:hypothetical protein